MNVATHRIQVLELVARAAVAIDEGDGTAWAACFTTDGVLRTTALTEIRGRAALQAFAEEWRAHRTAVPRHVSWHHQLEADGNDIVGSCSAAVVGTRTEGARIEFTARYRDRYRREDGAWRIAERVVERDRAS